MAVSRSEVEGAIRDGAHTREAVTRACRAGGDCGACHGMIATMIEDHADELSCGMSSQERISCEMMAPASGDRLVAETSLVRERRAEAVRAA